MDTYISTIILDSIGHQKSQRELQTATLHIRQAYAELASSPFFRIVMEDLTHGVLLRPCKSPEDEGERRLVLKIIKAIGQAEEELRRGNAEIQT